MAATSAPAKAPAHSVGGRVWAATLKRFRAFDAVTESRYALRLQESIDAPHDTDLARRVDLLGRELSFGLQRTAHHEETGEVLPHPTEARHADTHALPTLYLCPVCKATEGAAGRFVGADVMPGGKHFGALIPCPRCCPREHGAYVATFGALPVKAGER